MKIINETLMKNKIFFTVTNICFAMFLASCQAFYDQHIILEEKIEISKSDQLKSDILPDLKISVQSAVNDGDLIGFRIEPNINHRDGGGRVFIKSDPSIVINKIAQKYAQSRGFKITNDSYNKDLQLKLMYLDYRSKVGGFTINLICNIAIKATLRNNQGEILYEKWYFISRKFDRYHHYKTEITTHNINKTLNEIVTNIFADNTMFTKLKAI